MELLEKVKSSNDFGLRKIFPWNSPPFESNYLKTFISEQEKSYVTDHVQYIFKSKIELRIERIENPYLWGRYVLRYEMKADSASKNVTELIMIHATSSSNAYNIAEKNFDWRICRERARFGGGAYFAKSAQYARHYATEKGTYIVAGVLVANSSKGYKNQYLPLDEDDTSTGKTERNVSVKYYDNDFYPYYIVQAS